MKVDIGEGHRTVVGQGRAFGDVPGDITGHDERRVVGTGNGDGDVLGGDSELIIGDRHGKDRGDLFAFTEEVERGLEDGVIPGDRAVIGVARHVGDGEGILDGPTAAPRSAPVA